MIEFIIKHINEESLPDASLSPKSELSFLDIGTGNGHLLFQLHEDLQEELEQPEKQLFKFHGIDYSPDSITFAKDIAATKYKENRNFTFDQVDLLSPTELFLESQKFDILLDKGTLDAIALNQDPLVEFNNKRGMCVYAQQVVKMMKTDSVLLITSCNFTEQELVTLVTQDTDLKVWDKIKYPNFSFGGVDGSTVVSIAFTKTKTRTETDK